MFAYVYSLFAKNENYVIVGNKYLLVNPTDKIRKLWGGKPDPFAKDKEDKENIVTIIDIKDGWVKYRLENNNQYSSLTTSAFKTLYSPYSSKEE